MESTMKEMQKREAVERLKILEGKGLHPAVRSDFEEGKLHYSERTRIAIGEGDPITVGVLYWVDNKPEYRVAVERFERENDALVYHATFERTAFGALLDLLYVSLYEEEWEDDREDLKAGCPFAYVVNLDDESCSEVGGIGIQVAGGGIVRTA